MLYFEFTFFDKYINQYKHRQQSNYIKSDYHISIFLLVISKKKLLFSLASLCGKHSGDKNESFNALIKRVGTFIFGKNINDEFVVT